MWRSPGKRRSERRPERLVFGLGNPGRRYEGTFHNAGFRVLDRLAAELGVRVGVSGDLAWGVGEAGGVTVLLGKPLTYMNRSGDAVAPLYRRYAGSPEELIVLHDDLDIPLGSVRLKRGGGTGGHKGLASIGESIGTGGFLRVRIGIGRPPEGQDPADFVLTPVPPEAREAFEGATGVAADAVLGILRDGFAKTMTRCNARR